MIKRLSSMFFVVATGYTGICATSGLLAGDADRGKDLFRTLSCRACHSINAEGGKSAPDLVRDLERDFSPHVMAGRLWNRAPVMWAAMETRGIAPTALSEQQAADLFLYLFTAGDFEQPGDARRGQQLFQRKRCVECHGIGSALHEGIQPVAAWQPLADPLALAEQMWNHSREMKAALNRTKIPDPQLSAQELTDLVMFLRATPELGRAASPSPASVASAEKLFVSKGCASCHRGAFSLEARSTRYGLTDFAAALWNHPFRIAYNSAPLNYEEMRRLAGYLVSMQFLEERGDLEQGERVYARKRCDTCHDDPSSGAPPRPAMAGKVTSFVMVAALWKHAPLVGSRTQGNGISWRKFSGSEMADLTAYLHGYQLKQRPTLTNPSQSHRLRRRKSTSKKRVKPATGKPSR